MGFELNMDDSAISLLSKDCKYLGENGLIGVLFCAHALDSNKYFIVSVGGWMKCDLNLSKFISVKLNSSEMFVPKGLVEALGSSRIFRDGKYLYVCRTKNLEPFNNLGLALSKEYLS